MSVVRKVNTIIAAQAIAHTWPGAIVSCFYKEGATRIVFLDASPVKAKTKAQLIAAQAVWVLYAKWKQDIAEMDKDMPRWLEDHISASHAGDTGNAYQQEKYNAKKTLRAKKP